MRLENILTILRYTGQCSLLGCPHLCWRSWPMWFCNHSIIFERSRLLRDITEEWKRANPTVFFKREKKENLKTYRLIRCTLFVGKLMGQLILVEMIYKLVKDKRWSRLVKIGVLYKGEIMFDQLDSLLQWDGQCGRWTQNRRYLSWI